MSSKSSQQKQAEAFKKAARDLGCDEDEDAFDRALRKIASEKPPASVQKRKTPGKGKRAVRSGR